MIKRNLHGLRKAGRRDRTSLKSHTCMCKIRVTINSTKESTLGGGTIERFDLVWVALGKERFRKDFPEHRRMRKGGRVLGQGKSMDEGSRDRRPAISVLGSQIYRDSNLEVQERSPDFHKHFRHFVSSTNIY